MRVLITGANGFLGAHLCEAFLSRGDEVYAVLRRKPNHDRDSRDISKFFMKRINEQVGTVFADLHDFEETRSMIGDIRPDVLIHLAAIGDVTMAGSMPLETFRASAIGSVHLLEALRQLRLDCKVLNHSTDKVYVGNAPPFVEDMPFHGSGIYEIAKQSQDMVGTYYGRNLGMPIINVRCGNYFGGWDLNFNRIIPYVNRQLLLEEDVTLRSDGKMTRDFLHVDDAVGVNLMLIDALDDQRLYGETFNFSLEVRMTVLEVVKMLMEVAGRPGSSGISIRNDAKGEIPDMMLDCQKARRLLGWRPMLSFQEGVAKTAKSYQRIFADYGDVVLAPARQ